MSHLRGTVIYWMRDHQKLETLSRGVFALASAPLPESLDVSAVMRRIPRAVLCLVSALDYHAIGTQIPKAVQVALPKNVPPPHISRPKVEVFNMADSAFRAGVEVHSMASADIRVFSVAKTVADCFSTATGSVSTSPSKRSRKSSDREPHHRPRSWSSLA